MRCTNRIQKECTGKQIAVLIMSRAGIDGYFYRKAIRRSWLNPDRIPPEVVYRFVVGRSADPEIAEIEERLLDWEMEHFGDILRYSLPDIYADLYQKTSVMFQWKLAICPQAALMLKIDDDTAISLERLSYWTKTEITKKINRHPRFLLCNVLLNKVPYRERDFRWHVPIEEYPSNKFPEYCNGAIYLLTHEAVAEIYKQTVKVEKIRLEDVLFTGIIGNLANVTRFDTPAFSWELNTSQECSDDGIPIMMGIFSLDYDSIENTFHKIMNLRFNLFFDFAHECRRTTNIEWRSSFRSTKKKMMMNRFFGLTSLFIGTGILLRNRVVADEIDSMDKRENKPKLSTLLETIKNNGGRLRPSEEMNLQAALPKLPQIQLLKSTQQPLSTLPTLTPIELPKVPNIMELSPEEIELLSTMAERAAQITDILLVGISSNDENKSAASIALDNENIKRREESANFNRQPKTNNNEPLKVLRDEGQGEAMTLFEALAKYVIFGALLLVVIACCWLVRNLGIKSRSTVAPTSPSSVAVNPNVIEENDVPDRGFNCHSPSNLISV
ncbi:Beta-1,3-galactosyltransferase 5-like protein [Aphelenchoides besseyi]|nr:Beta-1,3-galactosyltransferase 5-like protein [Aphelenchoides besseyi]